MDLFFWKVPFGAPGDFWFATKPHGIQVGVEAVEGTRRRWEGLPAPALAHPPVASRHPHLPIFLQMHTVLHPT